MSGREATAERVGFGRLPKIKANEGRGFMHSGKSYEMHRREPLTPEEKRSVRDYTSAGSNALVEINPFRSHPSDSRVVRLIREVPWLEERCH